MSPWVYDPQTGGSKIPLHIHDALCKQAEKFASGHTWYPRIQLKLRFKNQFCYVDTIEEGDERLLPLCRMRYFNNNGWSLALFTYSNERYMPCTFPDGKWEGTFVAALEVCDPFVI